MAAKTAPPKTIRFIGQSSKRTCPTCGQWTRINITADSTGWQVWHCEANGCRNDYQITGRVN